MTFTVYDYEEGTDEATVPTGNGVDAIGGTPTYEADAAVHDSMGVSMTGTGQYMRYVVGAVNSGSIYVAMPVNPGSGSNRILTWGNDFNATNLSVRFASTGTLSITNFNGTQVGATSTTTWLPANPPTSPDPDLFRLDWQFQEVAPGNLNLTVRIFKNANVEGTTPNETITRTAIPGSTATTNRLRVACSTAGWTTELDTLRLSPLLEWATPFGTPPEPDPFTVYDFEEGTDGAVVAVGFGRDFVLGTTTYEADAAIHGGMGIRIAAAGAFIRYVAAPTNSGSVYLTTPTNPGTGSNRFLVWGTSANGTNVSFRYSSNGTFSIADTAANQVGASSTTTFLPGDTFRFDWQYDETAVGSANVTIRIFKDSNREGDDPDEEMTRTVTGYLTATNRLRIAMSTAGWVTDVDTLRVKDDVLEWAGPYGVADVPAFGLWNGTTWEALSPQLWNGTTWIPLGVEYTPAGSFLTYDYEEGVDGGPVPVDAFGVVEVNSGPLYEADAAFHETMGLRCTGLANVNYSVAGLQHAFSIYTRQTAMTGSGSNRSIYYLNASNQIIVGFRFSSTGQMGLIDESGTLVGESSGTQWTLGEWFRIDGQLERTGAGPSYTYDVAVRIFRKDPEGRVPDETLRRTFASTYVLGRFRLGSTQAGCSADFDTLRFGDELRWFEPYEPGGAGPAPAVARFPGDPGATNFYIGWAEPQTLITAATWSGKPVSIYHGYSTAANARVQSSKLDIAINNNCVASQSFKLSTWTPAQIVTGSADAAIDDSANMCLARDPWPIWLCYYHEPEDNFTTATTATQYRAAYRYIVQRFRDAGVTNVAWMPIYMCPWTFDGSGRNWRWWHADWTGTGNVWHSDEMMDLFGLDIYDPLPDPGITHHDFSEMLDTALADRDAAGAPVKPIVIPEFGMSNVATPTPDWDDYCADVLDRVIEEDIVGIVYWNNNNDSPRRYDFTAASDPTGEKLSGWQTIAEASVDYEPP